MYSNEDYLLNLLVEAGYMTAEHVQSVRMMLSPQESTLERLAKNGDLSEEQIALVAAQNAGMDFVELGKMEIPAEVLDLLSVDKALRYKAVPIALGEGSVIVAIADPLNFDTLDSLPHVIGQEVTFVCATPSAVENLINSRGAGAGPAADEYGLLAGEEGGDAPIIRMVTQILIESFRMRASDIHIEPMENRLRIRFRIDGKLIEVATHPKKLLPAVIARIKVMSGTMSIAEKRLPQDGRIQVRLQDKDVDLRVSSVPSNHGESIVMRILDKSALLLGLPELGFFSDDQQTFEQLIALPDGIILVTGPTGSGKTTTLYACLNYINKPDRKIITVEDPVEYELPGINQVMVKADIGMTFAAALRAMLRQAPNIIMIGEIRDVETANIAINAALTGHLVFSTLHTNDAPSAVARLADIGVKRFLIASAVRAVMAQRLSRKLCPNCKAPAELSEQEMRTFKLDASRVANSQIFGPVGCDRCRGNGFRSRMGLFELFRIDDEVRHMINENLTTLQLRKRARELGMRTLREDGTRKVLAGLTSAQEVMNITMGDQD